jgi:hypothetical protein
LAAAAIPAMSPLVDVAVGNSPTESKLLVVEHDVDEVLGGSARAS